MITSTFIFSMLSPFASFFAAGFSYECMVTEEGNFFNEKFPSFIIVIYAALGSASAAASDEAPPSSPLPSST